MLLIRGLTTLGNTGNPKQVCEFSIHYFFLGKLALQFRFLTYFLNSINPSHHIMK